MRGLLAGGLLLSLGSWTAVATGGDVPASVSASEVTIVLGRPEAVAEPASAIGLGRPLAIAVGDDGATAPSSISPDGVSPGSHALTMTDPGTSSWRPAKARRPDRLSGGSVIPVSYSPAMTSVPSFAPAVIRGQSSDAPLPMPSGPGLETAPPPLAKPSAFSLDTAQKPEPIPTMPQPVPKTTATGPPAVTLSDDCTDAADCGDETCEPRCCRWFPPLCLLRGLWHPGECMNEPYLFWAEADYLLWTIKDSQIPPLVTMSPPGTPRAQAGVIGAPGTTILFGGNDVDNEERSGLRFTTGLWFDCNQCLGLEGSFFYLGQRSVNFDAASAGVPILARPFFDVNAGVENSELIAFPGVLAGSIAIRDTSRLWGTELNLRGNWLGGCCWKIDWLAGFRYLALDESLTISENLMIPSGVEAGTGIFVNDSFWTHNSFVGGQVGLELELRQRRWSVALLGKVALGNMHETANIAGSTTFMVPGLPPNFQPGGLLAQPTNIGHYERDRFAVVPEVGIKVGYQISKHWRAVVGYSFLYASDVVRPGNQIDRGINVTQLPSVLGPGTLVGAARPAFTFHSTDFWAQGVNFGLEFRW